MSGDLLPREGMVSDATDPTLPIVLVGGATTALPVANYAPGYSPAEGDKVLVLEVAGTRWLIGAPTATATRCELARVAVQSIATNTLSSITLDTATYDEAPFAALPSITATIPLEGTYAITGTVTYATATLGTNYAQINIGGGTRTLANGGNGTNVQHVSVASVRLAAGTAVVLQTMHNNGGAQNCTATLEITRITG